MRDSRRRPDRAPWNASAMTLFSPASGSRQNTTRSWSSNAEFSKTLIGSASSEFHTVGCTEELHEGDGIAHRAHDRVAKPRSYDRIDIEVTNGDEVFSPDVGDQWVGIVEPARRTNERVAGERETASERGLSDDSTPLIGRLDDPLTVLKQRIAVRMPGTCPEERLTGVRYERKSRVHGRLSHARDETGCRCSSCREPCPSRTACHDKPASANRRRASGLRDSAARLSPMACPSSR